ncbi:unnamed protein product [Nezara viridula]|uniref:Uncharacterized protein n=1 Tax=Nezara viridula TaxID=85310 RepID=A0A9P0MXI6_NEZVI|nr:unnamed protein product [Nezara viridula]
MARKMIDFSKLSPKELQEFRDKYDAYIFDLDGCLIHIEAGPIEGMQDAIKEISNSGKSIHILTDNCLNTSKDIADKIASLFPSVKRVKKLCINDLRTAKFEEDVGAVLVAGDLNFNYLKMFKAANYLADPNVLLIQAHLPDIVSWDPVVPGVGAMALAVRAGAGRKEMIALGKGSDLLSDMAAGNMSGMDTMLTVSGGMCGLKDVELARVQNLDLCVPTYYTNSAADLIKAFKIYDRATARKMIDFSKLSSSQLYEFRNRYDAYIFDVDGCLVTLRNGPIDGVNEALCEIARNGKTLMVLTDNCLHTLNAISAKVNGLFPAIRKLRKMTVPELIKVKFEGGVGAVSIAGDTNFNYFKIFKAVNYLADPEVLLLQTHLPILVHMKPILLGDAISAEEQPRPIVSTDLCQSPSSYPPWCYLWLTRVSPVVTIQQPRSASKSPFLWFCF